MNLKKVFYSTLALGLFFTNASFAEDKVLKSFLGLSVGFYNVLDGDQQSADIRLEYRHGKPLFSNLAIKPWAGVLGTTDKSFWLGGGLYYDFALNQTWTLTPSLGVGAYHRSGNNDVDLGHPTQFRTQMELSYRLKNEDRLGLAFSHFSNASLGDSNTGVESLALYYLKSL